VRLWLAARVEIMPPPARPQDAWLGLNLSRGRGQQVSNAAEQGEHDGDPPCDLEGAASISSRARRRQRLERVHRPSWPNARRAILVSVCLSHHKSLADPSLRVLLLRAKSLRVRRLAQQIWQVAQLQRLGLGLNARAFPRPSLLAADGIGRRPSCSRGEGRPPRPPPPDREMRARGPPA
jgi:hypothetical protein